MKTIKEDPIAEILKKIAPGTSIRDGLDNILKAKTGALLLITDKQEVIDEVVDGGFYINEEYTSSKLYELLHMNSTLIKVIVDTIIFVINFVIQREWVFKKK